MTLSKPPPPGTVAMSEVTSDERQLAARNHGFLTEALRYPTTPIGMHYLLTHYDVPVVEPATWSLEVGGLVEQPVSLTLEEIKSRPAVSRRVTLECAGNGRMALQPRALSQPWGIEAVGTAEWTGTPLRLLLDEVGVSDAAVEVVFAGIDLGIENDIRQRYERSLTLAEALRGEVLLVYAINGQDLPPQHGYPLRLIVPGWYGMTNVKWLSSITAVDQPFEGYQQGHAYRMRSVADERGTALERIRPRALMAPPGIPDYFTRYRSVAAGPVTLQGRAWSGFAPIASVEVTTDRGETWREATLEPQPDRYAWVGWMSQWEAEPGEHLLGCRAATPTATGSRWSRSGTSAATPATPFTTSRSSSTRPHRSQYTGRDRFAGFVPPGSSILSCSQSPSGVGPLGESVRSAWRSCAVSSTTTSSPAATDAFPRTKRLATGSLHPETMWRSTSPTPASTHGRSQVRHRPRALTARR
jgi:sulfane dehydrogenase subunit SoxC